jgi:hypothetical protein
VAFLYSCTCARDSLFSCSYGEHCRCHYQRKASWSDAGDSRREIQMQPLQKCIRGTDLGSRYRLCAVERIALALRKVRVIAQISPAVARRPSSTSSLRHSMPPADPLDFTDGYASSLRDRRRKSSGVQLGPTAKLSNPSCFMSGVRPIGLSARAAGRRISTRFCRSRTTASGSSISGDGSLVGLDSVTKS